MSAQHQVCALFKHCVPSALLDPKGTEVSEKDINLSLWGQNLYLLRKLQNDICEDEGRTGFYGNAGLEVGSGEEEERKALE